MVINNHIFNFIYDMAVKDALNRVSEEGDKEKINSNIGIKEVVRQYAEAIINGKETEYSIGKIASEVEKVNSGDQKNCISDLTFGIIQKLINMTMKYLYIYYANNPELRSKFDICDAPMDGIMMEYVYYRCKIDEIPIGFRKTKAWSSLKENDKDYVAYQEAINRIIEKHCLKINKIEFDYIVWNKAKELQRNKSAQEKRKLVEGMKLDTWE